MNFLQFCGLNNIHSPLMSNSIYIYCRNISDYMFSNACGLCSPTTSTAARHVLVLPPHLSNRHAQELKLRDGDRSAQMFNRNAAKMFRDLADGAG
jgi:hypothetical protein